MAEQQQDVSEGGQALQAGRDIVVNNGMSAEQMSEIIVALTKQISTLTAEATATQDARFAELKDALLLEFAKPASKAKPEALSDPDFQYVVRDAHEVFARRGDADLKAELVNLISERSVHQSSTRVAQTLNAAIELAGKLSKEEYAALVVIFALQNVVVNHAHIHVIATMTDKLLAPFTGDLPSDGFSIQYLESLGCVSLNRFASNTLASVLVRTYAHALGPGFTQDELRTACGDDAALQLVAPLTVNYLTNPMTFQSYIATTRLRFLKGNEPDLLADLNGINVDAQAKQRLVVLLNSKMASENDVMTEIRSKLKCLAALERFWAIAEAQQASVSMVGRALAHSALVGRSHLTAPLEIWVK